MSGIFALDYYDYILPPELIAQTPTEPRHHSRLLISQSDQTIRHKHFYQLVDELNSGDVLVRNNSAVIPARLMVTKKSVNSAKTINQSTITKSKREILLIEPLNDLIVLQKDWPRIWVAMIRGQIKPDEIWDLNSDVNSEINQPIKILSLNPNGTRNIEFLGKKPVQDIISIYGQTPLPPYIEANGNDFSERYQTTYALQAGSVAAPTAGLHFTPELIEKLKAKGVIIVDITLHVGIGTFKPVQTQDIRGHQMHAEWAQITSNSAKIINQAKIDHRRIIAVGTTSARTLEGFTSEAGEIIAGNKKVDIFIYPGYKWKTVSGLITNFHLPKSSLLMMIEALVGAKQRQKIYAAAINQKYRFYSFGDASLLWR